ncbi:MAG: helix-turn-helix domain-containing protein [Lachnospiraceae bacterium]|nr:helix-turn-helix domain-containing protein [Lachnospiraceae bacterium]
MKIETYEDAILRIKELEKENKQLKVEIDELKSRKTSGRKKHNDKWMESYNDFAILHEKGMTIVENAKINNISVRTAYRYKAYFDSMNNKK